MSNENGVEKFVTGSRISALPVRQRFPITMVLDIAIRAVVDM